MFTRCVDPCNNLQCMCKQMQVRLGDLEQIRNLETFSGRNLNYRPYRWSWLLLLAPKGLWYVRYALSGWIREQQNRATGATHNEPLLAWPAFAQLRFVINNSTTNPESWISSTRVQTEVQWMDARSFKSQWPHLLTNIYDDDPEGSGIWNVVVVIAVAKARTFIMNPLWWVADRKSVV